MIKEGIIMGDFTCIKCGKNYKSRKKSSKFCCKKCQREYYTRTYYCDYCNKEITITKSAYDKLINGERKHKYCSKECAIKGAITSEIKKCNYCGEQFISYKNEIDKRKYCSLDCYNKQRSKMIKYTQKVCPICKESFRSYRHNQIYCSSKCSGESQKKQVSCLCDNCGKEYKRKESDVKNNIHNFCSLDCKFKYSTWNDDDIQIMYKLYGKINTRDLQSQLSQFYPIKTINSQAIKLGITTERNWSKDEEEIVLKYYENVPRKMLMEMLPKRSSISIYHKGKEFGLKSYYYLSREYSSEDIKYLRNNYLNQTDEELGLYLNHSPYGISQKLQMLNLHRPKDINNLGYTELNRFVRARIESWRNKVREENNWTCCLTKSRSNIVVHHCRGFNILLNEAIDTIGFEIKDNFIEYDLNDLENLVEVFLYLQEYYKEYVCICKDIHILFHKEYGYGDNTMEQWENFVSNYNKGYYLNTN